MTSSTQRSVEPALALIGASAGGPRVLRELTARLPVPCAGPVLLVQHMTPVFISHFCEWLATYSSLPVAEARPGARLQAGTLYVVARKPTLVFAARKPRCLFTVTPPDADGPSVDRVFVSAAQLFRHRLIAVLLSGMGEDGAVGLKAIADAGGRTIVQDEATAAIYGMPGAANRLSDAHETLSSNDIALALAGTMRGPPRPPWTP